VLLRLPEDADAATVGSVLTPLARSEEVTVTTRASRARSRSSPAAGQRGLGRSIAHELARLGASIVVNDFFVDADRSRRRRRGGRDH
jgi:hypothetical protein